jgi:hypothetical protein
MKRLIGAALCLATALPAFAADNFTKGCAFYNSGHYNEAMAYLQDTVSKKPRYWQGHYYLAHTYLALDQRPEAYGEYRLTQTCNPPREVLEACQTVMSRLAASTSAKWGSQEVAKFSGAHQAYISNAKQALIDQGNRDATRIRDASLRSITEQTNTSANSASFDIVQTNADKDRVRALQMGQEKRAKDVWDAARNKAKGLQ